MEITNIKRFSEVYNNLREYFNRVEPYTYQQESLFPQIAGPLAIKKGFNASDWDIPCSSSTFKNLYDSFIDELSNAVLDYSQNTVVTMLKVHFVSINYVFKGSLSDVFKFDREDLIELIESFNEATKLLYNFINDSETAHDYGLIGYYDSFKEESMKNREKRISRMQVKEGSYTNEDFENRIQTMFDNGAINEIVNETIREFLDVETLKSMKNQSSEKRIKHIKLVDYFYHDESIMQAFLSNVNNKVGKPVAIEIKALCELGKIDFSNMSAFLRSIGIDKSKEDAITRCFRQSSKYYLDSFNQHVIAAKQHYK
ncbi:hypothetical protein DXB21_22605 [Bacteroides faecis]|uniref:hypothetical protein n=1 Tax=Bacteroides TaxID=816 RepID=UPI000E44608D|nr:hypothetical protein [Bacteroides faecis]MCS2480493.1 hypothetical protein [Bacteroides faecis]RGO28633.1 hypothetical protein DXB21_22605 [Bacteroides faecis]